MNEKYAEVEFGYAMGVPGKVWDTTIVEVPWRVWAKAMTYRSEGFRDDELISWLCTSNDIHKVLRVSKEVSVAKLWVHHYDVDQEP